MIAGDSPYIDLKIEKNLQTICLEMISQKLIKSMHDVSDGGIAISLAECSIYSFEKGIDLGAKISLKTSIRPDYFLFGEDQSRVIISTDPDNVNIITELAKKYKFHFEILGEVIRGKFIIDNLINLDVTSISGVYKNSLKKRVDVF